MKSIVRKLAVPIYTIRSTSSSSIYRDLCPLLGLNPMTAKPSVDSLKATAAAVAGGGQRGAASGSYDSSGSMDEDGDGIMPVRIC